MPIHVLPPEVAAKIAAGEVVERPASVVKELIENSLDAGATAITVEVADGGLELIRVSDNGCGLPSDQAALAFERHATSKLSSADDLASIATLGFRGEALPSIAAVSHLTILTRSSDEEGGFFLELEGGTIHRREPRGAPQGTTVTVQRLFRNVPARLKFVRSRSSEGGRIQQVVHQYILAYPEVRFTLRLESRPPQVSGGTGRLRDALAVVYDPETAGAFLELPETQEGGITISGCVTPPSVSRSNRNAITLLVNRRWVQSRLLSYALEEAYRGFLQERRHPLAVVNIALPYREVDVNVHPTKSEVRFREEGGAFAALQRSVREALTTASPVPTIAPRSVTSFPTPVPLMAPPASSWPQVPAAGALLPPQAVSSPQAAPTPKERLPVLRVLGQVQDTYIVAEGPDGVYLVDQHAAHERVVYERVREEITAGQSAVQGLLEPVLVEVPLGLQETLAAHLGLLEQYGFQVESFGSGSYLVRGVPAPLGDTGPAAALLETLEELAQGRDAPDREERLVRSLACHGAVRAGKPLAVEEMNALLRQLEECHHPQTCPHGRPTIIHLSATHLEREFGRR